MGTSHAIRKKTKQRPTKEGRTRTKYWQTQTAKIKGKPIVTHSRIHHKHISPQKNGKKKALWSGVVSRQDALVEHWTGKGIKNL